MALCSSCGGEIRPGDWPFCGGDPSKHEYVRLGFFTGNAKRFDPVVVFRDRQGRLSVPGRSDDPTPPGCERVVADDIRAVRSLERKLRGQTIAERERDLEQKSKLQEAYGVPSASAAASERRARLVEQMKQFSPAGRQFAEHTMKRMDEKRARRVEKKAYDPGGGFEAFNYDRSNRLKHDDPGTGHKDAG